jgi:hypothetical protein
MPLICADMDREPVDADLADQIRLSGEEIKAGCLISFDELCREAMPERRDWWGEECPDRRGE